MSTMTTATEILKQLDTQYKNNYYKEVLPQIFELASKGIISFELGELVLLHKQDSSGFELRHQIKIVCKVEQELKALKDEVARLNEIIDTCRYS